MTATPPESQTFPVLDTLRLVGALGVLVTHVAFWTGAYTAHPVTGPLLARLDSGVAIFFVLSGFLLSRQWLLAVASGRPRPGTRHYLWKRLLRVYPLYVVTALIALLLIEENSDLGLRDALVTLLMVNIYLDPVLPAGLSHMWSLATEVAFYVTLPLLMALGLGKARSGIPVKRLLTLITLMFVLSVAWLAELGHRVPGTDNTPVNEWLPAFLGWFGGGMLLALVEVQVARGAAPPWVRRACGSVAAQPGMVWALVLGVLMVASTPLAGPTLLLAPTEAEAVTKSLLYLVIGVLVVASGVFVDPSTVYYRVMSAPWLRHLGTISYGIFCIHLPILHFVRWVTGYELFSGDMLTILALTLVLTLIAAEALYRWVEMPFMRLKDRGRPRPAPAGSPRPPAAPGSRATTGHPPRGPRSTAGRRRGSTPPRR